jgi:hypothetical protein
MICGGGGWYCRVAVIEFAMALVWAAISERIARNSSDSRAGIAATAVSMRSTRPSNRLSWNPRKLKPPIITTAMTPITQRIPSMAPFRLSSRASTDARQLSQVPDGGGAPFPPSVLVRSSCWRSSPPRRRRNSKEMLLTASAYDTQKCLNMFQTLRSSFT